MPRKEPYCSTCNDMVEYVEKEELRTGNLKGIECPYMRRVARCTVCDTELDLFNDENLKIFYDAYRTTYNIISLEKIREIPIMYGIGKRTLSLILGWGEHTYSRYYDGAFPTKPYSDILERLYVDPIYYKSLLENYKDMLGKSVYNKSKNSLDAVIRAEFKGMSAISRVVSYLLQKKSEITKLSLQKLLYYVQSMSSVFLFEPIFLYQSEAWVYGPVYRDIYNLYNEDPKFLKQYSDDTQLTTEQKELIDIVVECFGCYDGEILIEFTHRESPWLEARGNLSPIEHSNEKISIESIVKYFTEIKEKYKMKKPSDMKSYARDMFDIVTAFRH